MKIRYLTNCKARLMVIVFLFVGVVSAEAGISFLDGDLTVTGSLRQQLAINMGHINPYNSNPFPTGLGLQTDKNRINLCRTWLMLELDYRPNNTLRLFTKLRGIYDQTNLVESDLYDYNALALSPNADYGWAMRAGKDEHITAEVWEIYGDIDIGPLWMRFGRQQVVWGEMIGSRILDIVNPLDRSWHFDWEPEEYENTRIPLWMARAIYTFEDPLIPGVLGDIYIEGFWNPFDIVPSNMPQPGNPYNTNPSAGGAVVYREDRRGDDEYGFRIGGIIGPVGFTLNYAHLFTDDGYVKAPFPPAGLVNDSVFYPDIDMYGISLNYALDAPINIATSMEIAHYPDMPWQVAMGPPGSFPPDPQFPGQDFKTVKQTDCAIRFQRFCRVFPDLHQMMNVNFQYQVRIIGDHEDLKITGGPALGEGFGATGNRPEKFFNDAFVLTLSQAWHHNVFTAGSQVFWQPDGAYRINPSFMYGPGDHWRLDASLNWWGGSAFDKATAGYLNYFHYQDEAMLRVTYQF